MRISNVVMLAIALVCAAAAGVFTRAWLIGQSARTASTPQTVTSPTRAVVVAARDLKYGEKLTVEALKLVPWSGDTMPKGAFLSKEAALGPSGSRVVLSAVSENEPVLEQKLVGAGSNSLPARMTESMKAVTIRVNDVAGVAGFVQPDDRVDVFFTYGTTGQNETATPNSSAIVVLLQNIRVLAVDQVTQRKDVPTPAKAVTLEVTIEDAQKVQLAGKVGELSLALNRVAANGQQDTGTIILEDLLDPDRASRSDKAQQGGPRVGVTRGVERKEFPVAVDGKQDESIGAQEFLSHQPGGAATRR